ncbi:hypothetical protein PT129_04975 [Erysipelothrix rhusiopathiae]|nr:hypothetical protein [Erysipelothrix rhusiopathiae]
MKPTLFTLCLLLLLSGCHKETKQYSKTEGSIGSDVLEVEHLENVVVPELLRRYQNISVVDTQPIEEAILELTETEDDSDSNLEQTDISSYGINYNYSGDRPDLSHPMIAGMPSKLRQYFYAFRRGYHEVPEGSYAYVMPHEPYIYLLQDWMIMDTESMYHEMAHLYGFATGVHDTLEWEEIYLQEWQDGTYGSTNTYEAFAESVAGYFITPDLLYGKPQSSAYVDQIFKDSEKPIIPQGAH